MLSTLKNAWKIPELRKKMLFTLFMLLVFRLGASIPVPYVNREAIAAMVEASRGGVLDFLNMMGGGSFSNFSIFSTNIYPYITASIVIQLLTFAIPKLEELAKEGEEGKKKIARITRYLGLALAALTALGYTRVIFAEYINTGGDFLKQLLVVIVMTAGTAFLVWMGDMITEKGVGNGISLIIFVGIVSRLPLDVIRAFSLIKIGQLNIITFVLYVVVLVAIVTFVVALQEGERRIPVQYAKRMVGRKMYGGQSTHIPMKVAMSGVMPVIFANALLSIPQTVAMMLGRESSVGRWIAAYLTQEGIVGVWVYSIFNFFLVLFFAYFYTSMQFNTVEYSKSLQQNGGFIPGIRPGRPTSDFLNRILSRVTFVGGFALAVLATLPILLSKLFGMNTGFTGTGVIIVVGVALETVKQIEAQMMMRHYKGFLNN